MQRQQKVCFDGGKVLTRMELDTVGSDEEVVIVAVVVVDEKKKEKKVRIKSLLLLKMMTVDADFDDGEKKGN